MVALFLINRDHYCPVKIEKNRNNMEYFRMVIKRGLS